MKYFLTILIFQLTLSVAAQDNFTFYYNQGIENHRKLRYSDAVDDFSNALKHKKDTRNQYQVAGALMERALCKMYLERFSAAQNDIDEALKLKPEFTDLYFVKSLIYLKNKEYDNSIRWANKGLEIKPENEELMMNIIQANLLNKNYPEALLFSDSLLKFNSASVDALNAKADALQRLKRYKESIAVYSKVIEMDPHNMAAFYNRGIANAYDKNFDTSLADMNRAMAIDTSELWVGYNNIGFFINFEQKDYKAAIESFDKAIKLNPKGSNAYNNRGYAKLQLNDLKGARADIGKALELDPENSYAYRTMALYFIAENKTKQACEQLEKASKLGYTIEYDDEVDNLIKLHCK